MKKLVLPLILLITWETIARAVGQFYFPPLLDIFNAFLQDVNSGQLLLDLSTSAERLARALCISIPLGVLIGSLVGANKTVKDFTLPTINALRVIPPSALIPLVIMFIGVNTNSVIFMICISSIVPVMIATIDAIEQSVEKYRVLVQNLELNFITAVRKIYLPSAMPAMITGTDLSLTMGFRMLIFAEFMGVNSGIGFRLSESGTYLSYARVYYLLIVLSIFGLLIFTSMKHIKKRVLKWM